MAHLKLWVVSHGLPILNNCDAKKLLLLLQVDVRHHRWNGERIDRYLTPVNLEVMDTCQKMHFRCFDTEYFDYYARCLHYKTDSGSYVPWVLVAALLLASILFSHLFSHLKLTAVTISSYLALLPYLVKMLQLFLSYSKRTCFGS